MSLARVMTAGAVVRASVNTAGPQGGGDKKQGLAGAVTGPSSSGPLGRYLRTRGNGGITRNWVFCINQLGGVGHKWGQFGPGNRAGVSASCSVIAAKSRKDYPLVHVPGARRH